MGAFQSPPVMVPLPSPGVLLRSPGVPALLPGPPPMVPTARGPGPAPKRALPLLPLEVELVPFWLEGKALLPWVLADELREEDWGRL